MILPACEPIRASKLRLTLTRRQRPRLAIRNMVGFEHKKGHEATGSGPLPEFEVQKVMLVFGLRTVYARLDSNGVRSATLGV